MCVTIRAAFLLVFFLTSAPLAGQVAPGSDVIRGQVTDAGGQGVAGAQVVARSETSGLTRSARTNGEGRFTVLFPETAGRYQLTVSAAGMEPQSAQVSRIADEEVLLVEVRLAARRLDPVTVEARRAPPGNGAAGAQSRGFSQDALLRLPLADGDPNAIAGLAAGVSPADSSPGFSALGQRTSQNQVTLDGASFAALLSEARFAALPSEGLRSAQVITSTYDVARGRFSGALVAIGTRPGTNKLQGSLRGRLTSDLLSGRLERGPWEGGQVQEGVSGGAGGPIIRDRLFYHVSAAVERRESLLYTLSPREPAGFALAGVHPDSVARFLSILREEYGIGADGQVGGYRRGAEASSVLARIDFAATADHTLSARGYATRYAESNVLVGTLDLLQNGAALRNTSSGAGLNVTSRLGTDWTNEFRVGISEAARELEPVGTLPDARVRVGSPDGAGTRLAVLTFGAEPVAGSRTEDRLFEIGNDLSRLVGSTHRIKAGGLMTLRTSSEADRALTFGSFTFNSLADLEAGTPASFSRQLGPRRARGTGWDAALYLGDTWRPQRPIQVTYGVRVERTGYEPAGGHEVSDTAFGLDAGDLPAETAASVRAGFSWRLSADRAPLRMLRGGVGEFRGTTPFSLYTSILSGTAAGATRLVCIGDGRVPAPDFRRFAEDEGAIPAECIGDGDQAPPAVRSLAAFADGFRAPVSRRASIGFLAQLRGMVTASVDLTWVRGLRQFGVRDLNLRPEAVFRLSEEAGRPVYVAPGAIRPESGLAEFAGSRIDPAYGHAFEVHSRLASELWTMQLQINGILPSRIAFQGWYTLSRARDQSSFPAGSARTGFLAVPTAGDPNRPPWSISDTDRRHAFTLVAGVPGVRGLDISLVARAASGAPFTPRVVGDVNGDGAGNDAAFIFAPEAAPDTALGAAMQRLLRSGPARIRSCLRSQTGRVAARNSCRGPWDFALDLRAEATPRVPALGRRLSVSLDLFNVPGALDVLLHGAAGRRGWGGGRWGVDPRLLYVTGFDPESSAFRYAVNERFGRSPAAATAGPPFSVVLSARVAIGPDPQPDPFGGFSSLGMGSEPITVTRNARSAAGAAAAGTPDLDAWVAGLVPDPVGSILQMREVLQLSDPQMAELRAIRDSLMAANAPIRAEVRSALAAAGGNVDTRRLYDAVGTRINEGRKNAEAALQRVRSALTPEQWARVPEPLRTLAPDGTNTP